MVVSVLFQPTQVDEELQLATYKSLSLSSSSLSDDDADNDDIVYEDGDDDDDHTIPYDNTTTLHPRNTTTRQQELSARLEEQRIWQTSPSSVVQIQVVPKVIVGVSNTTLSATNNINSNINSSASTSSTTTLSIPTLRNTSTVPPIVSSHSATETKTALQKPFFIMDFLEDIDPISLALVQERIQQQQQQRQFPNRKRSTLIPKVERDTNINDTTKFTTNYGMIASTFYETSNHSDDHNDTNQFFLPLSQNHDTTTTTTSSPPPPPFLHQSITRGEQYRIRGWKAAQCGEYNRAIQYWEDALEIQEQIQQYHSNPKQQHMADTYHHIGIAYGKIEQYHDALQYLNKALEIRIDTVAAIVGDDTNHNNNNTSTTISTQQLQEQLHIDIASSLYVIGDIYQKQNQLSMALQFFIQCKVLQEGLVGIIPRIHMARTCIAIGHTYAIGEAYSDAYEAYQDAMTIFHQCGISTSCNSSMNPGKNDNNNNEDSNDVNNRYYAAEYKATLSNLRLMEQKK